MKGLGNTMKSLVRFAVHSWDLTRNPSQKVRLMHSLFMSVGYNALP